RADTIVDRLGFERPVMILAALFAILVVFWSLLVVRRMVARLAVAQRRIGELEGLLNETEAALTAEPNLLIVWRGREESPDRVCGDMRGTANVPQDHEALVRFDRWLEPDSAASLSAALAVLRLEGKAFNFGIKSLEGELLEADGRTAGGLATLRLRPLAGDRQQNFEMAFDRRKLSRQVERLSAILDSAPLAMWLRDAEGELAWVNRAYLAAVENDDIDEVLQRRIELVDPLRPGETLRSSESSAEPRRAYSVIGGAKRALDVYEVMLDEGRAGFAIDMTQLEDAQKELDRHIRAHAGTLDKLATAIAIFGPDQRLRFYNSSFADLWPLDPQWLDTRPLDGEILDRLRSARKLPEQANYREWKLKHLAAYTNLEPRESWWHLPDGQSLRVVCEHHPFGGVTYLYENVTEKLKLESRYNELIGVQRETLDNLHEGVALFGTDGCLRLYNPSYARFWKLEAPFLDAHPHIDEVIVSCRTLLADDAMWDDIKYTVTALSDARRPLQGRIARTDAMVFDFAAVPLPDGNTLLTYVDMTASSGIERALRERAEALEAADRLKTDFLSNISYELRTPLNSIIGFTEGLSLGIAGPLLAKQQEYLDDIQTSSADLLSIIDAILDLTTIDAGAMELQLEEIDVAELLEATANAVAPRIEARDLTLKIELAGDAERFVGDRRRVRQVLANLLSNAIGFSDSGAAVRMGARRDGDMLALWVSDTGRGIEPEFQKRAFDRFQARPIIGGHRGPGLGL
ncbi:MAG TPA: histidine kinase dimerization/phospho-acceptor domain-containing protein, partial [Aestuariivirgaceae bacterium]|nr:histidine kinase dimerization/phospho-acceptor domain-containing protein [Aestuariivirgaceae bacterium]